jgi:uncharacterized GH25 family protein
MRFGEKASMKLMKPKGPVLRSISGVVILVILGACVAAPASAHELFLRAAKSPVPEASEQEIRLLNGSFTTSENTVLRDRMRDVSIVAGGQTTHPPASDWRDDKVSSYLKYRAGEAGTYVIGVSTRPKILEQTPDKFIEYLKHDGVPDTLAEFEKLSTPPAKIRERYSKHVRAIVQVGAKRTDDYSKALGYPVEILLDRNPADVKVGEDLGFTVLFEGKPVPNQLVKVSHAGFHAHDSSGNHVHADTVRTNAQGKASIRVNKASQWYLSLIHMQKVNQPDADYESNWATVTFHVN